MGEVSVLVFGEYTGASATVGVVQARLRIAAGAERCARIGRWRLAACA